MLTITERLTLALQHSRVMRQHRQERKDKHGQTNVHPFQRVRAEKSKH